MPFNPSKAVTAKLILLSGDEEQLRRRGLEGLLAQTGVQRDDFDLEITAADATSPVDWIASAGTSPFLAERRILVVRHLLRLDPEKAKNAQFGSLPASALLILVADDEAGAEDRLKRWRTNWEALVKKAGGLVESFAVAQQDRLEVVRSEAVRIGKPLSGLAADTLLEMTGGSVSRALDELEKLALFVGAGQQIQESDVRDVVVPSREWNVYKMVDSIISGAMSEALRQLRILVGHQAKAEDAAIARILPNVSRQLRLLWQARLCVEANCRAGSPSESVLAMLPGRPNITGESPYRQSALMRTAQHVGLNQLNRCLAVIADTDARLKGSLPGFSGMESLERMVLEMNAVLRA